MGADEQPGLWSIAWHPGVVAPKGSPHAATGFCWAKDDGVLVSQDGLSWELPGGRPEPGESWQQTFVREVFEEACARVLSCTLLGFSRGERQDTAGSASVLVRAVYRAEVFLESWRPLHETKFRRVVPRRQVLDHLSASPEVRAVLAHVLRSFD